MDDNLISSLSILQESIIDIVEGFNLLKNTDEYDDDMKVQLKTHISIIKENYINLKNSNEDISNNYNEIDKDIYLEYLENIESEINNNKSKEI